MIRKVWFWLSAVCMILALSACSESSRNDSLTTLRDQAIALEQDHHDRALRLDSPPAIREETASYAQAMHRILEDMEDACTGPYQGEMMMGGHHEEDMLEAMRSMHEFVEDHHRRIDSMDDLEAMWADCEQHHRHMSDEMGHLDEAMGGGGRGMHRSH